MGEAHFYYFTCLKRIAIIFYVLLTGEAGLD